MIAPFDTHISTDGNPLAELQAEAQSETSLIDEFIAEIKRLNATICDMPTEEIEGLRSEAREKQHAISKAPYHDPLVYIYAAITSVCNIELKHRIDSELPPESVVATASG